MTMRRTAGIVVSQRPRSMSSSVKVGEVEGRRSGRNAQGEVVDGSAHVFVDEVAVHGDGGRGAFAGGGDDLGSRVGDVARDPAPPDARLTVGTGGDPPVLIEVAAKADEQVVVRDEPRRHEEG